MISTRSPIRALMFVAAFVATFAMLLAASSADDAGLAPPIAIDAGPAAAPAPVSSPPTAAAPSSSGPVLAAPRKTGFLWLGILYALNAAGATYRSRTMPQPGQPEPDRRSWRARSIAIASAIAVIAAAMIDAATGATSWWAVGGIAIAVALSLRDAFDPPKGSALIKPVAPAAIGLVLLLALSACRAPAPAVPGQPPPRSWAQDVADGLRMAREVVCGMPRVTKPEAERGRVEAIVGDAQGVLCPPPPVP